jgi:pentatricopeptide repeat protein
MAAHNAVNDPEGALRILDEMSNGGQGGRPDARTYVEAAESHLQLGASERALSLLDAIASEIGRQQQQQRGRGIRSKDGETEDEEASLSEDEGDEGNERRRRRRDEKEEAELEAWNQVLARFVQNGRVAEGFEVWRRMRGEQGLAPNAKTALHLIRACVRSKNMARAHQVVSNMQKFHKLKVPHACIGTAVCPMLTS